MIFIGRVTTRLSLSFLFVFPNVITGYIHPHTFAPVSRLRINGVTKPRQNVIHTSPPNELALASHPYYRRISYRRTTRLHVTPPSSPPTNGDIDTLQPKVYPKRWVQLGYLSFLALLSDWICFSVAASPSTFESAFPGHSAASLIDIFLFTNVASCLFVTDVIRRIGLSKAIKAASVLMVCGCLFRSGVSMTLVPYESIVAGTVLVGLAQPYFQCTPPLLSAVWFGSDERATSTAVALNFNQIGIATAFLVGGAIATSTQGLVTYFGLISAICAVLTVGTLLQFEERPPTPPSTSEIEKLKTGELEEPPFIESVKTFFSTPGFSRPLIAFICSISITNVVGAFIDEVLERGGITNQLSIDLAGAGFELAILIGGIIIGGYVDRTKQYKSTTLKCIIATLICLLPLGLTDHALGQEPILLVAALLGLGFSAGPVQPINAELAVDVTYPSDETAVESVQQIGGNLVSALLVPLAEIAAEKDYQLLKGVPLLESDIRGDVILLSALAIGTYAYFMNFDAVLKRSQADCEDDGTCEVPEVLQNGELDTELIQFFEQAEETKLDIKRK